MNMPHKDIALPALAVAFLLYLVAASDNKYEAHTGVNEVNTVVENNNGEDAIDTPQSTRPQLQDQPASETAGATATQQEENAQQQHLADESVSSQESGAVSLDQQLESAGLQAREEGDEGLSLYTPVPAPVEVGGESDTPVYPEGSELIQQLQAAGWQAREESDGTLTIFFPDAPSTATAVEAEMGTTPRAGNSAQLIEQLEAAGWQAREESDGTLTIFFPDTSLAATAGESGVGNGQQTGSSAQLIEQLRAAGWQAREESDGTLTIFFPDVASTVTDGGDKPQASVSTQLIRQLEAAGWQVREESDGTLTFQLPQL